MKSCVLQMMPCAYIHTYYVCMHRIEIMNSHLLLQVEQWQDLFYVIWNKIIQWVENSTEIKEEFFISFANTQWII